MSKARATIFLVVLTILIVLLLLFTVPLNGQDSFPIGNSDYDFYWISKSIDLGLDLKGGLYAVYKADTSDFETTSAADAAVEGVISNLSALLASKGYTEASVTKEGDNNIRVEVPNISDTEALMSLIGDPATLILKDYTGKEWIYGDKHLTDAYVSMQDSQYVIALEFNEVGAEVFAEATETIAGYSSTNTTNSAGESVTANYLEIEINGEVISAPSVNEAITGGKATISSSQGYSYTEAYELATKIKAGSWNTKLTLTTSETISATLGEGALLYTLIAAGVGIVLVIFIMIIGYRGLGLAASLALIFYTELLVFFLAIVPWVQLTLEGIAGVILSIGMAVDANVVIFEMIKDERYKGRGLMSAVKTGFKDAFAPILDGNVTTIIGAIIMIIFGNSAIKSFAIVLLIGILLSMFTCLVITRFIVKSFLAFNDDSDVFYGLNFKNLTTGKGGNA